MERSEGVGEGQEIGYDGSDEEDLGRWQRPSRASLREIWMLQASEGASPAVDREASTYRQRGTGADAWIDAKPDRAKASSSI